jgi:hypothetical protein
VLLDDREQVGEELALQRGEVGALDQRDPVLDGVDGQALGGLGAAVALAVAVRAVVAGLGLAAPARLGRQAARAVALVRNRNPSSYRTW